MFKVHVQKLSKERDLWLFIDEIKIRNQYSHNDAIKKSAVNSSIDEIDHRSCNSIDWLIFVLVVTLSFESCMVSYDVSLL
jgi:hypothetical protein